MPLALGFAKVKHSGCLHNRVAKAVVAERQLDLAIDDSDTPPYFGRFAGWSEGCGLPEGEAMPCATSE